MNDKNPKAIPVGAAELIAKRYGYDQIIILGRRCGEEGMEHLTTYGRTKEHCLAAAKIGNFLKKDVFGWMETGS